MSDWSDTELASVLRRVKRKQQVQVGQTYPAVSVLKEGRGLGLKEPFVAGETNYKHLFRVEAEDVVVRTITAFESPVAVASVEHDGTFVSQVFLTYTVDASLALPAFLRLVFQVRTFWEQMSNRAQGTVLRRKTISNDAFLGIRVHLPSIPEQRRIVDLIGALDAHIAASEAERRAFSIYTDQLRRALLEPKPHWERGRIADYAKLVTGRAFPHQYQGQGRGDLPYLKVSDLGDAESGRVVTQAANWVGHDTAATLNVRVCPPGTVLFPMIGAALLTEKRRVLGREGGFDQNVMGLVPGERITSGYLFALMSSIRLSELAQTGAVPSVNQSLVGSISVALPSLDEQREIESTLELALNHIEALRSERLTLQALRRAMLPSLLFEQIAIPDTYDSVLAEAG